MSFLESILASIVASILLMLLLTGLTPGGEAPFLGNPFRRALLWVLTSRAGLLQLYRKSRGVRLKLAKELAGSEMATLLQIRGEEFLTTGADATLRDAFSERILKRLCTRVLLLSPSSPYVAARAEEVGFNAHALRNGIRASLEELQFKRRSSSELQVRTYSEKPIFCIYMFDRKIYLSFYLTASRRQESPVLELSSGSALYETFSRYCEWLWSDRSESLEDQSETLEQNRYYYEIEEKVEVLDRAELLRRLGRLGAKHARDVVYHDYYFAAERLQEAPVVSGGEETRLRVDMVEGRIYRTHKLPFNAPNKASKRQRETCVGSSRDLDVKIELLKSDGFVWLVDFWKHCSNYELTFRAKPLTLTIAHISTASNNGPEGEAGREYLELEVLVPEDAPAREVKECHSVILRLLRHLRPTVSKPVDDTYIETARSWSVNRVRTAAMLDGHDA